MNRPREKDRGQVRAATLRVRIRLDQLKRWKAAAARAGCSVSEWARSVLERASRM